MSPLTSLEANSAVLPKDLVITSQPDSVDKNYFNVTIKNLALDSQYSFQFQWVYEDGTTSEWSPSYRAITQQETIGSPPSGGILNNVSTSASFIPVTLATFPANAKRVDVVVAGGSFGIGKVVYSFTTSGSTNIPAAAGNYQVNLITIMPSGITSTPTTTYSIEVTDPTANIQSPEPSVTPSVPTVSSVLGAIQVAWDGKTSTGGSQPYGFNAAKVYVGTSSGFTPSSSNQVDVLNFANGQNTLDISVGTLVNGTAMTYGVDYYVKIATTNGTDTSTAVSASGNPVRIGQVGNGDIVEITADKIKTGTISTQTITVGAPGGKRVELRGSGNPIEIFGTGGTSLLSYNTGATKLTVTGDGLFTGSITGASGTFGQVTINSSGISSTNFTISNTGSVSLTGEVKATTGDIGGWKINGTKLASSISASSRIELDVGTSTPQILITSSSGNLSLSPDAGIVHSSGNFSLTPGGQLTVKGTITGSTFSTTDASNNFWNSSSFRMGTANTYINYSGSSIVLKSGTVSVKDDTSTSPDTTTGTVNTRDANSEITLNAGSAGLSIKGIPSLGDYTKYGGGGIYTNVDSNYNNSSYGMGSAARLRTIVQDYYDDKLYRGFAVYYGSRSSAPGGSTGLVGDLWVSW